MAGPRYLVTEEPCILGQFNTGDAVTMTVYDMDGNVIPLDNANCTEIAGTGVFKWPLSNLTNPISVTGITQYLFVMNNGHYDVIDAKTFGGYPDRILGLCHENVYIDNCVYDATYGNLTEARMRIYADGYSPGGASGVIATYNLKANSTGPSQFSHWEQEKT